MIHRGDGSIEIEDRVVKGIEEISDSVVEYVFKVEE